ncbi:MAG: transcriptional regulator, partial [Candidatus Amulumruptor sp.]|nr:transcriptional regulator [Candidatus Amulumruptor sp.]
MEASEKQWFVMRDLRRRNSNTLAIHELAQAGVEVFTPMTQMVMKIGGRKQRREVPVIQDLLFVHETKDALDPFVE